MMDVKMNKILLIENDLPGIETESKTAVASEGLGFHLNMTCIITFYDVSLVYIQYIHNINIYWKDPGGDYLGK